MCFSSGSDTDESEEEILEGRDLVLNNLVSFIWGEGVTQTDSERRKNMEYMESYLRHLGSVAKKTGYRQADSLYIRHTKDLEELLETERQLRKGLEEERTMERMGEEVRKIMREEMSKAFMNREAIRKANREAE